MLAGCGSVYKCCMHAHADSIVFHLFYVMYVCLCGDDFCLMFINSKNYPMTVPCCICTVLLQYVFNSLSCVVKWSMFMFWVWCVIYAAASAGGERVEPKSMIPSVAYLWLHQTLWLSAGWETGLQPEREAAGDWWWGVTGCRGRGGRG